MGKIKIIFFTILGFVIYKGYVAFTEFEIGVGDRVAKLRKKQELREKERGYWIDDVFRRSTRN